MGLKDLGPDEWRGSAEVIEDLTLHVQAFCGGGKTQQSSRLFVVCKHTHTYKKKKTKNPSLHLANPLFTLRCVYKYF